MSWKYPFGTSQNFHCMISEGMSARTLEALSNVTTSQPNFRRTLATDPEPEKRSNALHTPLGKDEFSLEFDGADNGEPGGMSDAPPPSWEGVPLHRCPCPPSRTPGPPHWDGSALSPFPPPPFPSGVVVGTGGEVTFG